MISGRSVRRTLPGRWWLAIRPHSLGTAVAPVLVAGGVAIGDGDARPWAFVLAVLGVALLLIGVNLANDYFDFRSGADPAIGGSARPLQSGVLPPTAFLGGALAAFALGGACGLVLAWASPPAVLLIGLAGALLGFFYTAPPLRLGYRGLGEVVVFLCLGPGAAAGAYAVISGGFRLSPLWAVLPVGFTVTALLHANNLRDLDDDARSGKRTLAVRLGRSGAIREYQLLIAAAGLSTLLLAILDTPTVALGLLLVPTELNLVRRVSAGPVDGRDLMRRTSTLNLYLAILLATGFALRWIV